MFRNLGARGVLKLHRNFQICVFWPGPQISGAGMNSRLVIHGMNVEHLEKVRKMFVQTAPTLFRDIGARCVLKLHRKLSDLRFVGLGLAIWGR